MEDDPREVLRLQLGQALERDLWTLRERMDASPQLATAAELAARAQAVALSLCALELGQIADVLRSERENAS